LVIGDETLSAELHAAASLGAGAFLLIPVASLYALPRRYAAWLVSLIALSVGLVAWRQRVDSELLELGVLAVLPALAFAPVACAIVDGWRRCRFKALLALLIVLALGYWAFMTTVIYRGEGYLSPDEYCWESALAAGSCEPSPLKLAVSALVFAATPFLVFGGIPAIVALLWYGRARRRRLAASPTP
jgi:hypothetical protein